MCCKAKCCPEPTIKIMPLFHICVCVCICMVLLPANAWMLPAAPKTVSPGAIVPFATGLNIFFFAFDSNKYK